MINISDKKVIITGGGPAGLFCAYCLVNKGIHVDLYEQMEKPGRKFILAGESRLNITNSEEPEIFAAKYGKNRDFFKELLSDFSPADLIKWYNSLGVETFKGSSGRIFAQTEAADEILNRWLGALKSSGLFILHTNHRLIEIKDKKTLVFEIPAQDSGKERGDGAPGSRDGRQGDSPSIELKADFAVFALGGASWPKTGSDGRWCSFFRKEGIGIAPLKPANCGFEVKWSDVFRKAAAGLPLKNIRVTYCGKSSRGELSVTDYGIEGGAVYDLGAVIRDAISEHEKAVITIDLLPDLSVNETIKKLEVLQGKSSVSNYLRKTLKISGARYSLLMELLPEKEISSFIKNNPRGLSESIKNLKLELTQSRPLEEAISTAGGVKFEELDNNLMINNIPGFYVIGEMADWEAPTGGYLLQGCFSTAYRAAEAIASAMASAMASEAEASASAFRPG